MSNDNTGDDIEALMTLVVKSAPEASLPTQELPSPEKF